MHLEVFSEGNSIIHKADPRLKIILFSIFSIPCAISSGLRIPLLYLAYSTSLIFLSRINIKMLLSRLFFTNFFIIFIWLFVPLIYTGDPYFTIGSLKITHVGIKYALSITIKCNAIIIATITLLSTSRVFSLAHAMLHFKIPKKLVTIFFLFYRYITVIHEEYVKIKKSLLIRGFVPRTNIHTYKTYAYIIGGMLIKSFERAEDIYRAMLCRGFRGFFPLIEHFEVKKIDILLFIVSISLFIFFWI